MTSPSMIDTTKVGIVPPELLAFRKRLGGAKRKQGKLVTVAVEDEGEPVTLEVRTLRGKEKARVTNYAFHAAIAEAKAAGRDPKTVEHINLAENAAAMIGAATFWPGTDFHVFTGPADPNLENLPGESWDVLADAANEMNRDKPGAHEEGKAGSGETASAATASSSPTS